MKFTWEKGWWGLRNPKGVVVFAELAHKGSKRTLYSRAAKALGNTWRQCYRKGWRVVPVMLMESGKDGKWSVWSAVTITDEKGESVIEATQEQAAR